MPDQPLPADYLLRFSGLGRVFGEQALPRLAAARFCIVGVGGVGSWAAEAAARSGIGAITLIDHDDIELGNINRQIHSLDSTLGQSKVEVLARRIGDINPGCRVEAIDRLVTRATLEDFGFDRFDCVIDAIDGVTHKMALIHHLRRGKIRFVTTGGAGGLTDPTCITVNDLNRCHNDPLLAKLRSKLRHQLGYSRNPKRRYGIDCVYSTQQPLYPATGGTVSHAKPGTDERSTLDCVTGLGSFVAVTAAFGFTAFAHGLGKYLRSFE